MGTKIITLDDQFATGEATIQPLVLWSGNKSYKEGITKHASIDSSYFNTIKPEPGFSYVLVLALGSWEYYGENRNGDSFPERAYKDWIKPSDVLTKHYKSFLTANNYMHHVNKDPNKRVGTVDNAFWNAEMHRVELLIKLDHSKAPRIAERINAQEFPAVSMGTKVPYDVCSICGNKAPTRKQYCVHLRTQMKGIIDGKKVSALNPRPRFFDISWVFKPADRTAFTMKKVAGAALYTPSFDTSYAAGEYIERMYEIKEAARKVSVIDKVIKDTPIALKDVPTKENKKEVDAMREMKNICVIGSQKTPEIPKTVLQNLAEHPLADIVSTMLAHNGATLSTPEVMRITIMKQAPSFELSSNQLHRAMSLQSNIFDLFKDFPQLFDNLNSNSALDIGPHRVRKSIVIKLGELLEKRAGMGEYLHRKLSPHHTDQDTYAYSTPLSVTDPATGAYYRTTRGAAIRAHDAIAKQNVIKTVGGGLLLGGAYHLISKGLRKANVGYLRPFAAAGLAGLGLTNLPGMGEHYMTDQGIPIPVTTELVKNSSAELTTIALPVLGTLGAMVGLNYDYNNRLKSGIPLGYSGLPSSRRVLDNVESFVHNHPIISGVGSFALGNRVGSTELVKSLGRSLQHVNKAGVKTVNHGTDALKNINEGIKLSAYVEQEALIPTEDAVKLPDINVSKLAEYLGTLILDC